jgi:hypothetical protein
MGTARQRYTCFKNIYCVGSTFIASVAVDVFGTDIQGLVVLAQAVPINTLPLHPHTNSIASRMLFGRGSIPHLRTLVSSYSIVRLNFNIYIFVIHCGVYSLNRTKSF